MRQKHGLQGDQKEFHDSARRHLHSLQIPRRAYRLQPMPEEGILQASEDSILLRPGPAQLDGKDEHNQADPQAFLSDHLGDQRNSG